MWLQKKTTKSSYRLREMCQSFDRRVQSKISTHMCLRTETCNFTPKWDLTKQKHICATHTMRQLEVSTVNHWDSCKLASFPKNNMQHNQTWGICWENLLTMPEHYWKILMDWLNNRINFSEDECHCHCGNTSLLRCFVVPMPLNAGIHVPAPDIPFAVAESNTL